MASKYIYTNGPTALPAHVAGEVDGFPVLKRWLPRRKTWAYAVCDDNSDPERLFALGVGGIFWLRSTAPRRILDRLEAQRV